MKDPKQDSDISIDLGYLKAREIKALMARLIPATVQIRKKEDIFALAPQSCEECNGKIEYWDKTKEEIIFQCVKCNKLYTIPYDPRIKKFYIS